MGFLFYVVASGLFAAAMLNEIAGYEGRDVAFDGFLRNAGGGGDLRNGVAGVGGDAGEDDTLGGVDAVDGADDAFVEADDEAAGVVVEELGVGGGFFLTGRTSGHSIGGGSYGGRWGRWGRMG